MTNAALRGKPDAGNPHVRFDEWEVAPTTNRGRGCKLAASLIVAMSMLAVSSAFADVADVTITASGSRQFSPGDKYGKLKNEASGEVTLTSSGGVVEGDAISFTSFDAAANAKTTFSGGWWDFGVLSAAGNSTNFFTYGATVGGRTTTLDNEAVVTNVGAVYLAGSSGTDNKLELKGGSSMTMRQMFFGRSTSAQRSKCVVSGGSSLQCLGMVSMTEASSRDKGKVFSGNEFTVTGEGSHLAVGGTVCLGRTVTSDGVGGSIGGNTFSVTDGASADLHGVSVAASNVHGMKNRVVFGRNSRVNMTSFGVNSANSTVVPPNYFGSNTIEIVDGAVVTNTGNFNFGYYASSSPNKNKSSGGNSLLISNATFVTKGGNINNVSYMFSGIQSTIRLSGADAKLTLTGGATIFFNGYENTFSVENGARFSYPNNNMTYSLNLRDIRLAARSGGVLTLPNGFRTGTNYGAGTRNGVVAENGGKISCSGALYLSGTDGRSVVNDGSISANGNDLLIGRCSDTAGSGTNCVLEISGTHPKVFADWNVHVLNGSRIVINLPAAGYDEGYAVSTNAVVMNGISSDKSIIFDNTTSTLVLNGAEEMLECHRELKKKAEYVLLSARNSVDLSEAKLSALQATLPSGMSLFKRTKNNRDELVLSVKPKVGAILIFW